jgi:hypothetical protein
MVFFVKLNLSMLIFTHELLMYIFNFLEKKGTIIHRPAGAREPRPRPRGHDPAGRAVPRQPLASQPQIPLTRTQTKAEASLTQSSQSAMLIHPIENPTKPPGTGH